MPITEQPDYPAEETTDNSEDQDTESAEVETKDGDDKDGEEYSSALLPRSMLKGGEVKPGDTITLKVDKILEDEILVCLTKDRKQKDTEDDGVNMDESNSKLESFAMDSNS